MAIAFFMQSEQFATAGQLSPADFKQVAQLGYKTVINNRPDGEGGETQPKSFEMEKAAAAAGLAYIYLPVVSGHITQEQVEVFANSLQRSEQPVLAFCRSGARSAHLAQLAAGLTQ